MQRAATTLNVTDEHSPLREVVVSRGETLVDSDELAPLLEEYGASWSDEAWFDPEEKPWDAGKARRQHASFLALLEERGVELRFVEPVEDAINQVYTRDVGFVVGETFFVCSLGDGVRRLEMRALEPLIESFPDVVRLSAGVVEGGDVVVDGETVFVGQTRYATSPAGFAELSGALSLRGYEAVPIHLSDDVLHLDCRFAVLSGERALLCEAGVHPDDARLLRERYDVIGVPRSEAELLGANVLSLGGGAVVVEERCVETIGRLRDAGFSVVPVAYDALVNMGGSFRCTTLPLVREQERL